MKNGKNELRKCVSQKFDELVSWDEHAFPKNEMTEILVEIEHEKRKYYRCKFQVKKWGKKPHQNPYYTSLIYEQHLAGSFFKPTILYYVIVRIKPEWLI